MKKYLYLLIACTMMCFAGCEEKGNEIDNTTDTGENVEINEANLVGTWKIVSKVDTVTYPNGYFEVFGEWFYEDSTRSCEPNSSTYAGSVKWNTMHRFFWNFAFTLNADHTYEYEDEYIEAEDKGTTYYDKEHYKENGTWSLKGKSFSIQWIEGCEEYLDDVRNKADLDKPYEETRCGTYEEYVAALDDEDWRGYEGSECLLGLYGYALEEEGAVGSISIIKLTSTELVVQTKGTYVEKEEDDDIDTYTTVTIFKKVK